MKLPDIYLLVMSLTTRQKKNGKIIHDRKQFEINNFVGTANYGT